MGWDLDCAVIGGGPGGLVSALYLGRFRRKVALFQHGFPRAGWIPRTHNLLGYDRGISGRELLQRLRLQVAKAKVPLLEAEIKVERKREGFELFSDLGTVSARKVIFATGIEDIQPEIPNLVALRKLGLLRYCPICDGFEFRDKSLALIVKDDEGARKAQFLRGFTRKLTVILLNRHELSAARLRKLASLSVKVREGTLEEIEPCHGRKGIHLKLQGEKALRFDAGYVELGFRMRLSAYERLKGISRARNGLFKVTAEQRLSAPGLFAVGDCVNRLAQISVAAGQAAIAATAVHNDLLEEM